MLKLAFIAAGGAAGALLRYGASGVAYSLLGAKFPWGTLSVNLLGSLCIGLLWAVFENVEVSPNLRAGLLIGLLGAFTTFSTFSLETLNLLGQKQYVAAGLNVVVSCVLGVAMVFAGMAAGNAMVGPK